MTSVIISIHQHIGQENTTMTDWLSVRVWYSPPGCSLPAGRAMCLPVWRWGKVVGIQCLQNKPRGFDCLPLTFVEIQSSLITHVSTAHTATMLHVSICLESRMQLEFLPYLSSFHYKITAILQSTEQSFFLRRKTSSMLCDATSAQR